MCFISLQSIAVSSVVGSSKTHYFFKNSKPKIPIGGFLGQKYPNKAFLVPNLRIFCFLLNFAIRQTWGCWFQKWQYYFQIPAPK